MKYVDGCEDVFSQVIDNIELLNNQLPDINITIRINLTKDNVNEYKPLINLLNDRFKGRKNISPAPAFVLDRGIKSTQLIKDSIFFTHREQSEYILKLKKEGYRTPFLSYPSSFFNECAIRNDLAISFDPDGDAYKCWEVIGNKKYSIGKLNESGLLTNVNTKILNRQLFAADPIDDSTCKECKYLPICNGGCPIQRIENEFEHTKNCTCTYYKEALIPLLKDYIDQTFQ